MGWRGKARGGGGHPCDEVCEREVQCKGEMQKHGFLPTSHPPLVFTDSTVQTGRECRQKKERQRSETFLVSRHKGSGGAGHAPNAY